ncbi:MAG TPA: hypothetical protein VG167_21500 [Verrucomicrobiae bacterium]|nr:hypothetical protein [Verrucomicrobiae bacterium]
MNTKALLAAAAVVSALALPTRAAAVSKCPRPDGVPALDELAGDWKTRDELSQYPSIHNFRTELLVNGDFASVSWVASPPFSQGFHSGVLRLNGKVPLAEKFKWYPYQSVRAGSAEGLAIETLNRMVFDERGVLWRINLSNTQPAEITATVAIDLIGAISKLTETNSWDWAFAQPGAGGPQRRYEETEAAREAVDRLPPGRPSNAEDYTAGVLRSERGLLIRDTKTPTDTLFAFHTVPDHLDSDGHQGTATWRVRLAPGQTKVIEFLMAFGERDQVGPRAESWARNFGEVFDDAKTLWEQRYAQVFTPNNGFFEQNLPVLQTEDPAIQRNYYMGVVTMLLMLRDQLPYSPRVFLAGGPRYGASVMFIWDTGMMDTLFALLEPKAMRAYIAKTLQWDLDKYLAFDYYGNRAFGYRYVANYPMLFRIATTYLRVSRDRAFLEQKVGDQTVLQHLDRLALHYRNYLMPEGGLADFGGDPWHFLECVPTYIHATAGFNAAYVTMLRDMADLYDFLGKKDLAAERRAAAEQLVRAIYPQLYVSGKGFWQSRYPDGRQFDMRHCLDFQFVAQGIGQDLPAPVRKEMRDFVVRELLMKNWMRAQSLQDPAAAQSDRPDHGPMGAYSGWPPETVDGLCHLGYWQDALDFYRRCAAATHEGAFSQGAEFYGPRKKEYDAPVRIATAGTICREALCGADFTDVIIRTVFGFHPSLNLDNPNPLWEPDQPRGFSAQLLHVRWGKSLLTITSGPQGLTSKKE